MVETILWTCSECGKLVEDKDGHLSVSLLEASAVERRRREQEGMTVGELMTAHIESAPWLATHFDCSADMKGQRYSIDIERIRTPWAALRWTGDVMEKEWVRLGTDWLRLLQRLATAHDGYEAL